MSISIPISSFPRPWYLGLPTLVNQGWTLVYQRWLTNVEPWLTNVGFFHFLPHFCHIWWFFNRNCIFYHFWYYPLWKIIKYGKNLGKNEKNQRWLTKVQHWLTNVGKPRYQGLGNALLSFYLVLAPLNKMRNTSMDLIWFLRILCIAKLCW